MSAQVIAQSSKELLDWNAYPSREFILLAGKDGVGKSSAIVSVAWWVEQNKPNAVFYVIDSENKFKSALRSFGSDAPQNIQYYKITSMNEATEVAATVMGRVKTGDWLAIESMGPIWDMAQDLGTQSIAGVSRVAYMDAKRGTKFASGVEKKGSPIPGNPDDYWRIVKGAYDGAFLDLVRQSDTLNVILTSVTKSVKEQREGGFKENKDRKAFRIEVGMDANLSGSPTMPSLVETLCLLELSQGNVSCRVLRDNLSSLESSRIEFPIATKRDWAVEFWAQCRNGELKL
jgi:hypothetical protein